MFTELEWLAIEERPLTDKDISKIIFYLKKSQEKKGERLSDHP